MAEFQVDLNDIDYSVNNRWKAPYKVEASAPKNLVPSEATRVDYMPMDEKMPKNMQTSPITVTPEDKPKQEFERLSEAKRQFPYLQNKDFDYVENLTDDKKAGYLEFWEPGDEGPPDGSVKRPEGIGIDRMGIEVRNPNTRPIDILGDYVSHEAVYSDPKLKDIYDRYTSTLTDEQLKVKYEYEKKNYGEDRPFEQWAERSGKPGMFRGYTFDQFSEDEIKEAYTEEQLKILDEARDYLGIKKLNYEGKDVKINNKSIIDSAYDKLLSTEGAEGDQASDVKTGARGLTEKLRDSLMKKNPEVFKDLDINVEEDKKKIEALASKLYLQNSYDAFSQVEGFNKLTEEEQIAILDNAYNLGYENMLGYKNFMAALKDGTDKDAIFKNLLDTAKIEGKSSKGVAKRRAEAYNVGNPTDPITRVEQTPNGIIYYKGNKEYFRFNAPKAEASKVGIIDIVSD